MHGGSSTQCASPDRRGKDGHILTTMKPNSYWHKELDAAQNRLLQAKGNLRTVVKKLGELRAILDDPNNQKIFKTGTKLARNVYHRNLDSHENYHRSFDYWTRRVSQTTKQIAYIEDRVQKTLPPTWYQVLKRGLLRI
jgi:hypothetical protein